MNISLFKNVKTVSDPDNYELVRHLEEIRDGRWEDIVSQCRTLPKDKQSSFKETMPTATLSGVFSKRSDKDITEHSGYLGIDIDNIENYNTVSEQLKNDKYVYACFMSVSGTGIRAIFKIEPDRHKDAFRGVRSYLFDRYGIVIDPNGISPSKPYIVSFDPYLYLSPIKVPIFSKYVRERTLKVKDINQVYSEKDFDYVMTQITSGRVNICESYEDWLKVAFALTTIGEPGREAFHTISSMSDKYDAKATDKQFDYCIKRKGSGGQDVGMSSFYYLAKLNGVKVSTAETSKIVRVVKNGKRAGLSKKQIEENLEKFEAITGSTDLIDKVYESTDISEDELDSIIEQTEMFISNNYSLRMNEVTGYIENNKVRVSQSELNSMFIAAKKIVPKLDYALMKRLLFSDFIEIYNPFYEFFGSDGMSTHLPAIPDSDNNKKFYTPLIDKLCESVENDNPAYTNFFIKKWIISIVSAAHKVHSPLLLCLLGELNTGKTEFFRRLLPPELKDYYQESKLDREKDDEILMTENLIIMDDELGGKSKRDNIKLKNLTSKQYFSLRRPYGEHNEKLLRLAVLCGTSNGMEVLSDPTGNRRIIPIEVKMINKKLYNSINKKELFIEAYDTYRAGFDWRVTHTEDIKYLNVNESMYEIVIKERELISRFFEPGETEWMTTTDIIVYIELATRQRLSVYSISGELERAGFSKKSVRVGANTSKKWGVTKILPESQYYTNENLF